ncbi:MAG TPA: ATP-binding cassette domain-containing protein [Gaiellaceae bacterium]
MASIQLNDVAVRRGGETVWAGATLEIEQGELVAILGPNGSGKSTLLRLLLGLVPAAAGSAKVLGAAPGSRNDAIGYLPQSHGFEPSMRIRGIDIVRLGLDGNRYGLPLPRRPEARARVDAAIELVGAGAYARRPIGELSGGEQQRLLIAQALVSRPELVFLDEPLDGLDLPSQAAVSALLSRISRAENVTVLLVAHDVNPLLPYVDRVVYVAGGRVVAGAPAEVITTETLSALYGVPVEVLRASDGRLVVVGEPDGPHHHGPRHGGPEPGR